MLAELVIGVAIGYIPCELARFLCFRMHSPEEDVDNFGQDMAPEEV
jgi:hypothetical protein